MNDNNTKLTVISYEEAKKEPFDVGIFSPRSGEWGNFDDLESFPWQVIGFYAKNYSKELDALDALEKHVKEKGINLDDEFVFVRIEFLPGKE